MSSSNNLFKLNATDIKVTRFNYKLFAVMLFLFCAPAMAINKCTGIDDKLVFQDMPANWGQIPIKHANSKIIIFFDDTPSIKST